MGDLSLNAFMDVTTVVGVGEGLRAGYLGVKVAGKVGLRALGKVVVHDGEDAVAHVVEHEVADVAERGAIRVAAREGESGSMEMVRTIEKGERLGDIVDEAKTGMYLTGREHAVVTLESGTRALVRGGRYGINFEEGTIKRILFHTHPWDDLMRGPSDDDFRSLEQLGQASSHVYEHGQWTKFWNRGLFG